MAVAPYVPNVAMLLVALVASIGITGAQNAIYSHFCPEIEKKCINFPKWLGTRQQAKNLNHYCV